MKLIENKANVVVPTNDYVFKRIFGKVGNEKVTQGFISAILEEQVRNVNLEGNTILEKDLRDEKIGILDIKAKLNNEILCNIEMQLVNQGNIEKRILFYWSKLYASGIKAGEDYNRLNKTISILLLDDELENLKEIVKGHTEWKIREKEFKNTVLTEMLEIHIIELPKVRRLMKEKQKEYVDEELAKWVKFLVNPNELEESDMENNEALRLAKEELEYIQSDEYQQRIAELRMKEIMDRKSIESYGYEKGEKKGRLEGEKKGRLEGEKKGMEKGKLEEKEEIAKKLLSKGYQIEEIEEITGLTKEEIEKL